MASHETIAQSDEWHTPAWVFEAIGLTFALDPCNAFRDNPAARWCDRQYEVGGLEEPWTGSVWLNPPFGGRNGIRPWMEKIAVHGDGIALVPNRTGADWWQDYAEWADALLFVRGKIRFLKPDGTEGTSPGYGNVLMAFGRKMAGALHASRIGGFRA